jgi:hypothetical protein
MEILKSIGGFFVRMILLNIVLILFFGSAPLLYLIVPFWFLATHKNLADINTFGTIYLCAAPFVCAFWMTIVCHWQTVQKARRAGVRDWREAEGGMGRTVAKSFGFWFLGFFGTIVAEIVYCHFAGHLLHTAAGRLEFFAMAPFAVFAPVFMVWLKRWNSERVFAAKNRAALKRMYAKQEKAANDAFETDMSFLTSLGVERV